MIALLMGVMVLEMGQLLKKRQDTDGRCSREGARLVTARFFDVVLGNMMQCEYLVVCRCIFEDGWDGIVDVYVPFWRGVWKTRF